MYLSLFDNILYQKSKQNYIKISCQKSKQGTAKMIGFNDLNKKNLEVL